MIEVYKSLYQQRYTSKKRFPVFSCLLFVLRIGLVAKYLTKGSTSSSRPFAYRYSDINPELATAGFSTGSLCVTLVLVLVAVVIAVIYKFIRRGGQVAAVFKRVLAAGRAKRFGGTEKTDRATLSLKHFKYLFFSPFFVIYCFSSKTIAVVFTFVYFQFLWYDMVGFAAGAAFSEGLELTYSRPNSSYGPLPTTIGCIDEGPMHEGEPVDVSSRQHPELAEMGSDPWLSTGRP